MANWANTLRLQPEWGQAQDNKLSTSELAGVISARLKLVGGRLDESLRDERDEIIEEFESIASDAGSETRDLDDAMHRLYDWGDTSLDGEWNGRKVCWIDTTSMPRRA